MKYHFLIPVWGESYVKVFTEFSLPTQLSPGNLGAFVREPHALYKIVTRSVDIPHIEASRSFQILKSMMATEFVPIDPYLMLSPYRIFSKCHELGVLSSAGSVGDTVFFFGVADGVWSDGSLRRAKEIIDSGKRAVLVSGGFHVVQETFCPELRAAFFKANTPVLSCPPRQLLDLAFKHIQIITRSMMWDNGQVVNRMCAVLHWRLNENALLSRCWVFHPMAVRPRRHAEMVDLNGSSTTVDNVYVVQAGLDLSDLHFVTDSDEIVLLEMSPATYTQSEYVPFEVVVPGKYSSRSVLDWFDLCTTGLPVEQMKKWYIQNHIWYHSEDLNSDEKSGLEKRSDEVISEILLLDDTREAKNTRRIRSMIKKCVKPLVRLIGKLVIRSGTTAFTLFRRWFPEEQRMLGAWLDRRVELAATAALKMHASSILSEMAYFQEGAAKVLSSATDWNADCCKGPGSPNGDSGLSGSGRRSQQSPSLPTLMRHQGSQTDSKDSGKDLKVPYINIANQHAAIKEELLGAMGRVLDHGNFILGEEVGEFEDRFAHLCGVSYAVGVNSGTDALILALKAIGVGPGDEVITTPNAFVACTACITLVGARPVFVDVRDDYNIDPNLIHAALTPKTRAILVVHLTGRPADMAPILDIARIHNLRLIEDCAQAVCAEYQGRPVGSLGLAGCFSLHPLKTLNVCGDGGIVITNDEEISERIRILRNLGLRSRDECVGWSSNSRLDTLHAAGLLVKMKYLDKWTEKRRANARYYQKRLVDVPQIKIPVDKPFEKAVYHTFVILAENRDDLRAYLYTRGVGTAIHYPVPIHLQPAAQSLGYSKGAFPVTEFHADRILSLPVYPELEESQLHYVTECIRDFYEKKGK